MHRIRTKKNVAQGFSLIELLVSVALFTIVMVVSVGTLLALVDANQKAQTLKVVINNLNFSLDSITRSMRTGYAFHCATGSISSLPTTPADCSGGGRSVSFTDDHGQRIGFRFNTSTGTIERCMTDCSNASNWIGLTSRDITIEDARFYVTGALPGDNLQPMVTITVRGQAGARVATESNFEVQTSVTQRVLDQ